MTHQGHPSAGIDTNDPLHQTLMQLDEWRHLPSYQLERRVDVLLGMMLPRILQGFPEGSDLEAIPEFPLHKRLLRLKKARGNESVNVDFAVFCVSETDKYLTLVELKTDDDSTRDEQFRNMLEAKKEGAGTVLQGVINAANTSHEGRKYAQLIWRMLKLRCMYIDGSCEKTLTSQETYRRMCMSSDRPGLARHFRSLRVHDEWLKDVDMELVLIHPKKDPCEEVKKHFRCICFCEAADAIEGHQPPIGSLLAGFLRRWACQEAGYAHPWAE